MVQLGNYFGRDQQAGALVAAWKAEWSKQLEGLNTGLIRNKPKVLMVHFGQMGNSYLGLSPKGPAEQILEWAGGRNAIADGNRMVRLTPEMIAVAAPDVIIATDVGFDRYGSVEKFAEMPGVNLTPAGKNLRIYRIDEDEIMYFGPRTPAGAGMVARQIILAAIRCPR